MNRYDTVEWVCIILAMIWSGFMLVLGVLACCIVVYGIVGLLKAL